MINLECNFLFLPTVLEHGIAKWCTFPVYTVGILGLLILFAIIYNQETHIQESVYVKALFFIYAAHGLWVSVAGKLVINIIDPQTSIGIILAYISKFLILWYVDLGLYMILHKISPRFVKVLCGGRNK